MVEYTIKIWHNLVNKVVIGAKTGFWGFLYMYMLSTDQSDFKDHTTHTLHTYENKGTNKTQKLNNLTQ